MRRVDAGYYEHQKARCDAVGCEQPRTSGLRIQAVAEKELGRAVQWPAIPTADIPKSHWESELRGNRRNGYPPGDDDLVPRALWSASSQCRVERTFSCLFIAAAHPS